MTTSKIEITTADGRTVVRSPYNPNFVRDARPLGGVWNDLCNEWLFPADREKYIRELCKRVYRTDGTDPYVTMRITIAKEGGWSVRCGAIYVVGRQIARAWGRDSGARAGAGVIFVSGRPTSGGSQKNWYTEIDGPAVIDVLDMPEPAAREAIAKETSDTIQISILGEEESHADNVIPLKAV